MAAACGEAELWTQRNWCLTLAYPHADPSHVLSTMHYLCRLSVRKSALLKSAGWGGGRFVRCRCSPIAQLSRRRRRRWQVPGAEQLVELRLERDLVWPVASAHANTAHCTRTHEQYCFGRLCHAAVSRHLSGCQARHLASEPPEGCGNDGRIVSDAAAPSCSYCFFFFTFTFTPRPASSAGSPPPPLASARPANARPTAAAVTAPGGR